MTEREMVTKFKKCIEDLDVAEAAYNSAKKALDEIKEKIFAALEDEGKDRTASFEGIGFATAVKPKLYASCLEENKDLMFDFLKSDGREDLIKPTVHHSSLAAYVGERLENGKPIPEFISYGFKNNVRLYPPKK